MATKKTPKSTSTKPDTHASAKKSPAVKSTKKAPSEKVAAPSIIVRINARILPFQRGDLFEDPIDRYLKANRLGKITGGGTIKGPTGEIEHCDLQINLKDASQEILDQLATAIQSLGAPKGSKILLENPDREIGFGKLEGLAVYIKAKGLPEEVYEKCDFETVHDMLNRRLGKAGRIESYWHGDDESALYAYGTSFAEMKKKIEGFLKSYPLCKDSRVLQIA